MKHLILGLGVFALTACGNAQQASAPEPAASTEIEVTRAAPTPQQVEIFGALANIVGSTFEGLPADDSTEKVADIQTWEWALGGNAIVIRHALADGTYGGDSYIYKNAETGELIYLYITSGGFHTQGIITVHEDGSFTAEEDVKGHPTISKVRSTSVLTAGGASKMTSEYLDGDTWAQGHAFNYTPTDKPLPTLKAPQPK